MFTPTIKARQVLNTQSTLGEGPLWDPERNAFWWIDIIDKKLHLFDPATRNNRTWQLNQMPGTVVTRQAGGLVLALENGFSLFDPDTEEIKFLGDPESKLPENRFNDGKCDLSRFEIIEKNNSRISILKPDFPHTRPFPVDWCNKTF